MRRAIPLTREEWQAFDSVTWRQQEGYEVPVEDKMDSFGWVDGRIVAVDYGS